MAAAIARDGAASLTDTTAKKRKSDASSKKGGQGWKKIKVDDEFLLGLSEPGFQEIEELEDVTLLGEDFKEALAKADAELGLKAEGTKSRKKRKEPAQVKSAADADELQRRIAKLEAENAKLRASMAQGSTGDDADESGKASKKPAKKKKKGRAAKDSAGGTAPDVSAQPGGPKQTSSKNADSNAEQVEPAAREDLDMSAWDGYGLDVSIVDALAALGFVAPTAIQHECLPAAIQGNADIIGAAQTGSGKTLAFGLPLINYLVKEAKEVEELVSEQADAENDSNGEDADAEGDVAEGEPPQATEADEGSSEEEAAVGGEPGEEGTELKAPQPAAPVDKSERLLQGRNKLRALVLCPTRELALQVCNHMQAIAKAVKVRVVPIVGGISPLKQERLLSYKPAVVVATPGRLWDLMSSGHKHLTDLSHLSFLVLDEADRMVKQGNYAELNSILDLIPRPAHEQKPSRDHTSEVVTTTRATLLTKLHTYVFSATLTLPDSYKAKLQRRSSGSKGISGGASFESLMNRIRFRGKPKVADLTSETKLAEKISEAYVSCSESDRDELLYYLLAMHPGRTLVFANAISGVRRASALLRLLGLPAQALHAQQQQRQRLKALDKFKADEQGILVATDVAARGLDVRDVRCVIQYQLPPTADTYIHRAGRTARASASGLCISFVVPNESGRFAALHRALGRDPPPHFPVDSRLLKEVHARVRLAQRIDDIERIHRKQKASRDWMTRHSKDIGFDVDDDEAVDADVRDERERGPSQAALAAQLRGQLSELLARPLTLPMSEKFFTGTSTHMTETPAARPPEAEAAAGAPALPLPAMQATLEQAKRIAAARKSSVRKAASLAMDSATEGATSEDALMQHGGTTRSREGSSSALPAPAIAALGLQGKTISKNTAKKVKAMTLADYKSIALEKALAAKQLKKGKGRKQLVVGSAVKRVYGRPSHGADALATLKHHVNTSPS